MLKLAIEGREESVNLDTGRITLGRGASNAVVLKGRDVSRKHAEILRTHDGVYLVDLGSTNGTTVNGKLLKKPRKLKAWDVVAFGSTRAEVVDTEGRRPGRILRALGVARAGSPRSPSAARVPPTAPAWAWAAGGAAAAVGLLALLSLARSGPDGATGGGSPQAGPEEAPVAAGRDDSEVEAPVEGTGASRVVVGAGGADGLGTVEEPVGAATSTPPDPRSDNLADVRARVEEAAAADAAGRPRRIAEAARIEAGPRRLVNLEDLCHQDLKSIVVDTTSRDLAAEKSLYYDHIYQYVEEYPHWKYVGGGLIGIAYGKNVRSGNVEIRGNTDAEGENHVSLQLSGTGNLDGMPLAIGAAEGAFAYLMVPSTAEGRFASFLDIGSIRVLTTMAGEIVEVPRRNVQGNSLSFLKVTPRRENPLGTALIRRSPRDRWLGIERRYMEGGETVYERPETENLWLRTINASQERTVEIAGRTRRQRVLCRYKFGPIAATNDARFRPRIERELNAWVARHRAAAEAKERAEEVFHFAEVPREPRGDIEVRGRCGVTRISFPTRTSEIRIDSGQHAGLPGVRDWLAGARKYYAGDLYVEAELTVGGRSLGPIAIAALRPGFWRKTDRQIREFKRSAEVRNALLERDFKGFAWSGNSGDRGRLRRPPGNDDVAVSCDWAPEGQVPDPDTCWLRAERQVLEKVGCDP